MSSGAIRSAAVHNPHAGKRDTCHELIESSPAGVLALDAEGRITMANSASHRILCREMGRLVGERAGDYIPGLTLIARTGTAHGCVVECDGRRANGENFVAHLAVGECGAGESRTFSVVMFDATDNVRDREETGLDRLLAGGSIVMGAVSHEVRNLCSAIGMVHANLGRLPSLPDNEDFRALGVLVEGLEKIASADLHLPRRGVGDADLGAVLRDLQIVIEPWFRDGGRALEWRVPEGLPRVRGDHHALLHVFLNLARNGQRAMEKADRKLLRVEVAARESRVTVRFYNTGPKVTRPERLFQPFQPGAEGSGLGLYISREMVRAFGGEVRYEPRAEGSTFAVELLSRERQAQKASA